MDRLLGCFFVGGVFPPLPSCNFLPLPLSLTCFFPLLTFSFFPSAFLSLAYATAWLVSPAWRGSVSSLFATGATTTCRSRFDGDLHACIGVSVAVWGGVGAV